VWCPSIEILAYYGSQDERAELRDQILNGKLEFDVMITTYSLLHSVEDKKLFKRTSFEYVIFDEAHMLKNMKSIRYNDLIRVKVT
jgi:SWI/SNF-related matrix-associated actin-dependent regulator of chromatin subfamily A containing DEAD/H box 1